MSAIANITVKKYDGTTDVIWYGVQGASGQDPAIWQASLADAIAFQPDLRVSSRSNARNGGERILRITAAYPQLYTDTTTSLTSIANKLMFSAMWNLPLKMSAAARQEGVYQISNLMASSLMKQQALEGFAAV